MKTYSLHFIILSFCLHFSYPNSFTVKGKVINEKGAPSPNATITVIGTKNTTSSDSLGEFSIKVPGIKSRLVVSSVGYDNSEVEVKSGTRVLVKLRPSYQGFEKIQ